MTNNLETLIQEGVAKHTKDVRERFVGILPEETLAKSDPYYETFLRDFATKVYAAGEESGREKAVDFIEKSYYWSGGEKPPLLTELERVFKEARTNK